MTSQEFSVLGDVLRMRARLGTKVAFADAFREVTFAELPGRIGRLAGALTALGLRRGDRIALLGRNCVSLVECILVASAGFIVVPLNWRLAPAELISLLGDCAPAALVCDRYWVDTANEQILTQLEIPVRIAADTKREGWHDFESLIGSGEALAHAVRITPDDPALLVYTSGTTGAPKAATISHRGVIANGTASARYAIGVDESDTILCVMPLFHVGGLCYYLLASYMAGATSILRPMFDPNDVVESLARFSITNLHLVPTMISDLVGSPQAPAAAGSLRRIVYAGSTMPVALLRRAMATFACVDFSQSYGSTEAGIVSALGPQEHVRAASDASHAHLLQSCGRPLPQGDVRIVREDGSPCAGAQPGEVLVRSSRTMGSYWQLPEKTAAAFLDGYLRTGDIGYRDEEGYLYLVDRKNDMVVTGGENVFPSEVEQVLFKSPDIAEASVFGVPDARWIEKLVAAVVLRPGSTATPDDLMAFARRHLAGYKCPKTIHIVTELPRTGVGKTSRKLLRQRFAEGPMAPSG